MTQRVKSGDINIKSFKRKVKKLKRQGKLDKPCFIFGADFFIKLHVDYLKDIGVDVAGILDNNASKWGRHCREVPVIPVSDAVGKNGTILIASGFWRSMQAQLEKMGLVENADFINIRLEPKGKLFWSFMDLFIGFYRLCCGAMISRRLRRKYGSEKTFFLQHLLSLGDLYMASLFIPGYLGCATIGETDSVLIVVNKGNYRLAKALGYKNVKRITKNQNGKLLYAMTVLREKMRINEMVFHAFPVSNPGGVYCTPEISFSDMFYPYMFQNDDEKKMIAPCFKPNMKRIEQCFSENNLVEKQTVVIAPYTGATISDMSTEMWGAIIKRLKQRGYCVCTNSAGASEPPLEGTSAVSFPFEDAVAFVERTGGFIAARNGLCEIIGPAKCKKVIVYENVLNLTGFFFSINRMGLCDDAVEYDYGGIHSEELIEKIMGNFPPIGDVRRGIAGQARNDATVSG